MLVYLILIFVILLLSKSKMRYGVEIAFIFAFTILAFRGLEVGTDTDNYTKNFRDLFDGNYTPKRIEFLWYGLIYFFTFYIDSYRLFIIVVSFFTLLPLYIVSTRFILNKPLQLLLFYILLYFFFNSMNIMRQGLAMTWGLLLFLFYGKKKVYYFLILIPMMIHSSSIILLMLPFLRRLRLNKILCVIISLVTFTFGSSNYLVDLIGAVVLKIDSFSMYSNEYYIGSSFSLTRLLLNIFFIYLIYVAKEINEYMKIVFVGICILNLFSFNPYIARMAQYFLLFQIILYPNIDNICKKRQIKNVVWTYSFVVFAFLLGMNVAEIIPYYFSFD